MSYSFSISGHVDTQEEEWSLIQALAAVAQQFKASGTNGSTQFHGLVDLGAVQVGEADAPTAAGTDEPSSATPEALVQTLTNDAGEVVGSGPVPTEIAAAEAIPGPAPEAPQEAPVAPPLPPGVPSGEAAPLGEPKPILNANGEIVGYLVG